LVTEKKTNLLTRKISLGLGDSIAKVTSATGLDKVAEKIAKLAGREDCGCLKRKITLNKKFPYKKK
tara:strand:- start:185 stop:382 length:198 start_codon:yes stop_codon:yes gene_type:complete